MFFVLNFCVSCSKNSKEIFSKIDSTNYFVLFSDSMDGEITSWDASGDSALMIGTSTGRIALYSLKNGKILDDTFFDGSVSQINCVSEGCAVLFSDAYVRLFDENWSMVREFRISRGRYMPSAEGPGKIFYQKLDGEIFIFDHEVLYVSEIDITQAKGVGMRRPVKNSGKILFLTRKALWCLDSKSGNILWFSPFEGAAIPADFAVSDDTVFVSFDDGTLLTVESFDGRILMSRSLFEGEGFVFDVQCEDMYYIAENGDIGVYFRGSEEFLWNLRTGNVYLTKPLTDSENVLCVSISGQFLAVDRWTGRVNEALMLPLQNVKYFEKSGEIFIAAGGNGVFCVIGKK
ncbi:PQQ-binding-like beta-propeller repeat protein [candidate division WOR-3 bacterium]|nr:PQQ-binding-like beta-propeller repeat protein [candidate division WOR-3 bacterium]